MTSLLNPMRKRTSSGERRQFSVENAYADTVDTPTSIAPCNTSINDASPARCPSVRGRPRACAHRPLPSITIATCLGTRSAGMAGGRAPDGCGGGAGQARSATVDQGQRPQAAFEVPLQVRRDQAAGFAARFVVARVRAGPVAVEQCLHELD